MKKTLTSIAAVLAVLMCAPMAKAEVSAAEAAKLKSELTPLGGERGGNADGSIPAWTGEAPSVSGPTMGDIPKSIFPEDKPLYTVTAQNMGQYAALLTEGQKGLLQKFPQTYKIVVYPTRRTAVASQATYDATFANATNCKTVGGGYTLQGCKVGTPFPIPKDGYQAIWNYQLRAAPEAEEYRFKNIVVNADGSQTLATHNDIWMQYPYRFADMNPATWDGTYFMFRFNTLAPPFKAGESLVAQDKMGQGETRQAWQYLVGQRRVRRAPTVGYDTPDFVASGANYFDEVQGLMGMHDRFQWKLLGKKELLIPYNNNNFYGASVAQAVGKNHMNPDLMRFEKHRVWAVEATVAPGKRHAVPKRVYYLDEDSWLLALMDGYDANGKVWRTTMMPTFVVPKLPGNAMKSAIVFNLQAKTMSCVQCLQGEFWKISKRKPSNFFTGDAVAADAAR